FCRCCRARIQFAIDGELWRRWEIQQRLKFAHEVNLAGALQNVDAFLCGGDRISIEVRSTLFELGEVFDALQGALRAEQSLNVHSAQTRRFDAMPKLLGTNVAHQVRGRVGMAIRMTVEAGYTSARLLSPAIFCLIELLLWKRRNQQPQSLKLFRIQNTVERLVVILDRN